MQTVSGPLSATAVRGPVLAHEHLAVDARRPGDDEAVLDDRHADAVAAELGELREGFGLSLIIEQTCRGIGRDATALARIAAASGVAVVAGTGWYHEAFHPPEAAHDVG